MELKQNRIKIGVLTAGLFVITFLYVPAQNLCSNGSFENISNCPFAPNGTNQVSLAAPWISLNVGPDLFNVCYNNGLSSACQQVGVPVNFVGISTAHTGNGYAGIVTYNSSTQQRDYLAAPLSSPMIPGQAYTIECRVKRAERGRWATANIGICFSSGLLVQNGNYNINVTPQIEHATIITDTSTWFLITSTIVPVVPLDHITIGNFNVDGSTQAVYMGAYTGGGCVTNDIAYYYIDDVKVEEIVEQLNVLGDTLICIGGSTTLTAQANVSYWWSTAALPNDTLSLNPFITVAPPSTQSYILHGVFTTKTVTVHVVPPPVVNLGGDTTLCENNTVTLNAGNVGSAYTWYPTGETTQTISISNDGTYWVRVDNGGCARTDTVAVTIIANPQVDLGSDSTFCLNDNDTLVLDGGIAASYAWYPGGETTPTLAVTTEGTYAVVVAQQNGCTSTDTIATYKLCPPKIFIPNGFTPNGDFKNDLFAPVISDILDFKISIFNRWGQLVYESKGLDSVWDGKYKGKVAPKGVYSYLVRYNYYNETGTEVSENIKGWVTLLR